MNKKWLKPLGFFLLFCLFSIPFAALDGRPARAKDQAEPSNTVEDSAVNMEFEEEALLPEDLAALSITVENAVLMALENNRSLKVERLNPLIRKTFEDQEAAEFDPTIAAGTNFSREKGQLDPTGPLVSKRSNVDLDLGASKYFPTGTEVGFDITSGRAWSDRYNNRYDSRVGLSVTQALLQGMGLNVNLANLRQARLNTQASQYELRGFAEALVAQVEETYWDYILALRQIEIFEESMQLAEKQIEEIQEIINVGKLAETEIIAAQAEVALRRQELIEARNVMAAARLRLLRLLNPPGPYLWKREIILLNQPVVPEFEWDDVNAHVKLGLRMRPDMNQARLGVQNGEIEIVKTKNGLLPKMDLFISLGKTGYADSFGSSLSDITGDGYDVLAGLRFTYPFRNRAPRARHERAILTQSQAKEALDNLSQLVELDVRTAYIDLNSAKQQIYASKASRQLEEEKVRIETEKFRVGKSTSFLVAQAQRDLVRAQIFEIRSTVNYLKALVNLYRVDGSLLERWGIEAPGKEPVDMPAK